MDRSAPLAGRLRSGRLVMLSLAAVIAVGACGSSAAGGTGGGGGGDADKIIASSQLLFGTTMIGGEVQGDTIVLTLRNGTSKAMAGLFLCSKLTTVSAENDPSGTFTLVAVDESGQQLSSSADCK
jgi:hypothetical protein